MTLFLTQQGISTFVFTMTGIACTRPVQIQVIQNLQSEKWRWIQSSTLTKELLAFDSLWESKSQFCLGT